MQPDLTSDLSTRQWRWLVDRVGEPAAAAALSAAVAKGKKAYPLNAARELGLVLPAAAALPPVPVPVSAEQVQIARARLRELRASITSGAPR